MVFFHSRETTLCGGAMQLDSHRASILRSRRSKIAHIHWARVGIPISCTTRSCDGRNDSEAIEPKRNVTPTTAANRSHYFWCGLEKGVCAIVYTIYKKDPMENLKLYVRIYCPSNLVPWNRISFMESFFFVHIFFYTWPSSLFFIYLKKNFFFNVPDRIFDEQQDRKRSIRES